MLKKTSLKMPRRGGQNMWAVYDDYNAINSHIFIWTCWFYSHSGVSVHGHEIFKI